MIIQPIVEGHGEVSAVPELLRRLIALSGNPPITVSKSIRAHRSDLIIKENLGRKLLIARARQVDAVLIMLDGDDDCPATLGQEICRNARQAVDPIACEVVIPHREYEAWFLASMESLRNTRGVLDDATSELYPETHRDAKGKLESRMSSARYIETADQVAMTAQFDMGSTFRACRSFRRMIHAYGSLATASGLVLPEWPPRW